MALFKKKRSREETARASGNQRQVRTAPERSQRGGLSTSRSSVQDSSFRSSSRSVEEERTSRVDADRIRRNSSQIPSRRAYRASQMKEGRKKPPTRNVRAGSQQRMPLERITPSGGRRPSQRNTSARSGQQRFVATSSKAHISTLRREQLQGQAKRQQAPQQFDGSEYESHSVQELRQADRRNQRKQRISEASRGHRSVRRYIILTIVALVVVVGGVVGGIAAYNSPLFTIENVKVTGVEHLTADEMTQLANVPSETTLLRVDTETIAERVRASAWVEDVQVKRVFPDTLELVVTEREMAAIVEIPVKSISGTKLWAIADDTMWLMPIPDADSEAARTTSAKIYEDAENVVHIKDVPFGTVAEIGKLCTDAIVNNVMAILSGMTTELADMVVEVSASGIAETTLILNNGVEVAFGKAEDIRDKERVVLEILSQNPDGVAYINVRMVETPTWRGV